MAKVPIVAILLFGCGARSTAPKDVGAFGEAFQAAFGQRVAECFRWSSEFATSQVFSGNDYTVRLGNSFGKTRIVYDPAQAEACLKALPSTACADLQLVLASQQNPCVQAILGKVKAGETCYESAFNECEKGYGCDASSNCEGVCRKLVSLGNACDPSLVCEADLQCVRGLCRATPSDGQPCGGSEGVSCNPFTSFCEVTSAGQIGTCRARRTDGACDTVDTCALGYACMASDDTLSSFVCDLSRQEGESCVQGRLQCAEGTACSGSVCQPWPKIGGACGVIDGEPVYCAEGFCQGDSLTRMGTCTAPLADGSACSSSSQCASGTCDIFVTSTCVAACPLQ